MKKLWITYAWTDNENEDVDYIASELKARGIEVRVDRWTLRAGEHLWPQIEEFISDPTQSDAWMFFATPASLQSQPCMEEFEIAFHRVLSARTAFPIIALVSSDIDKQVLPARIATRLYVSLEDEQWLERVVAAVENRAPSIASDTPNPYRFKVHHVPEHPSYKFVIEMAPRAGSWGPCRVLIAEDEIQATRFINPVTILTGPRDNPPIGRLAIKGPIFVEGLIGGRKVVGCELEESATPTTSLYALMKSLPSTIHFGSAKLPLYTEHPPR